MSILSTVNTFFSRNWQRIKIDGEPAPVPTFLISSTETRYCLTLANMLEWSTEGINGSEKHTPWIRFITRDIDGNLTFTSQLPLIITASALRSEKSPLFRWGKNARWIKGPSRDLEEQLTAALHLSQLLHTTDWYWIFSEKKIQSQQVCPPDRNIAVLSITESGIEATFVSVDRQETWFVRTNENGFWTELARLENFSDSAAHLSEYCISQGNQQIGQRWKNLSSVMQNSARFVMKESKEAVWIIPSLDSE